MLETLWRDCRYACRSLIRSPGFTSIAGLTLAFGIGANTAIFSVVNAVLLRPLGYRNPEQLVALTPTLTSQPNAFLQISAPEYQDFKRELKSFSSYAASWSIDLNVAGNGASERLQGALTSDGYFTTLEAKPMLGRPFTPADAGGRIGYVAIISYEFWQRRFGGAASAIGQQLRMDDDPITVVGVMPKGFRHPIENTGSRIDIWVPIDINSPDPQFVNGRGARVFDLVARLNPGTTIVQAQTDLDRVTAQIRSQFPDIYRAGQGWTVTAQPLAEKVVGNVRSALMVLLGAVGFVLLISCLNVANLTLARASAKEREVAIRTALGGTPRQLARQMLTESLLLAMLGGILGLVVASVGTMALSRLTVLYLPRAHEIGIDGVVLAFTGFLVLLTGLGFGLMPALGAARANLQSTLKQTGRGSSAGGKGLRLRAILVVAEVAFALVLLAGAGLLIRSFTRLVAVDPGFNAGNLLTMQVWLSVQNKPEEGKYFTPAQKLSFYDRVRDQIQQVPGVRSMGFTSRLPLRGQQSISFEVEGQPVDPDQPRPNAERRIVSASYFPTMGIPIVQGQNFSELADSNAPLQVVVNQTLANRYWPNQDPVGRRVKLGQNFATIAGVAGDVHDVGLERPVRETMYLSYRVAVPQQIAIVVRTTSRPETLSQQLVAAVRSIDPEQPVFAISPMTQVIDDSTAERRFSLLLLSLFAAVALMLAGIGIYGVISHATEQRRQEIGIRRALGADAYNVFGLILKGGLQLVAIGLVLGLAGAWLLSQVLTSQLFGVGNHDLVTFMMVPAVLLGVSLLALYIPARRALKVHPMTALRSE